MASPPLLPTLRSSTSCVRHQLPDALVLAMNPRRVKVGVGVTWRDSERFFFIQTISIGKQCGYAFLIFQFAVVFHY